MMGSIYPIKKEKTIVHGIREDLLLELSVEYEPLFKLILVKRVGNLAPYSYDTIDQSVTRESMDLYVDGGSDGITREMAFYLFEKANERGFDVELTDELLAYILMYKEELLGGR